MADDKWVLDEQIPVPYKNWVNQEVRVEPFDREDPSLFLSASDMYSSGSKSYVGLRMSLDDAENFATLILFEVKRARGEIF
jgi:hypothetical protein